MKPALLVVALPLLAVLAGCIDSDSDGTNEPVLDGCISPLDDPDVALVEPTDDILEGMAPENAFEFETTNKRTCSLPAIGWTPLRWDGDTPDPHRYLGEIDMRADLDLGVVAALGNGETPTIHLVDIMDRANPKVIASITQENTYIVDVKISDDGGLLFAASQSIPTSPEFSDLPELSAPTGFTVYDISDPANPVYLNTIPDPQVGCHMLSHEIINGEDALFCISQQVRVHLLTREGGTVASTGFVDYFPQEDGAPRPSALPVGLPVGGPVPLTSGPHDMTVQQDPVTGQTLAMVSHWDSGLRVVDVSDLPVMTELGAWNGEGATHYAGNVHTAMMFYVGEDRYIVASPEYTTAGTVPSLWVLDATDYADLKLVAEWFHPGEHESQGLLLTTHQWQVAPTGADVDPEDVRIYLTYNHGGVWVLDFGQILAGDNQAAILGFNTARHELDPDNSVSNAILATWDVNVVDGYIYGSDRATGLWVFHYQGDNLGDPRLTGFA